MPFAPRPTRPPLLANLVFLVLAAGCQTGGATRGTAWPTDGWATSTPAEQGLVAAPLAELDAAIRGGTYGYIDRMVVVRNGYIVVSERYDNDYMAISTGFEGILGCSPDRCRDDSALHEFNYYHPDWHPYYQGRDVHTLQSVTKSVSSALIGIAIGRGEIASTDVALLSFFDDYDLSGVDPRLRQATLDDLLTMRTGIEWHEQDRPLDETNTTAQLEAAEDWIQFTLDQPSDAAPGEKWVYNSGASASTALRVEQVNSAGWGYGYQWWRLDQNDVDVWTGLGFGGQFLIVIPDHELIGVINSWNLFGGSQSSVLGPFINALFAAAAP